MNGVHDIVDEAALAALGQGLAGAVQAPKVILLQGDLGAGKTTLARAMIRHLTGNPDEEVPSPTFTLVQDYATPKGTVHHYDLYRLKDAEEVYELGWEDAAADGIALIEWPERLGALTPRNAARITLSIVPGSATRQVHIEGF